ncbi:GAF domain-containing protein [Halorarum salinum]|uniref:GAF domain-containing protein n=1 Tax=Halorarum salinum TaxID=2743089 RepID=A0A7D5LBF7_9EURY|nr:GAF domain-containing protein [Halobaculum salinum]QLG62534.1 GAF domain-containing protein [Halobaculum salinum]
MTDEARTPVGTIAPEATSPFEDGMIAVTDGVVRGVDEVVASLLELDPEELRGEPLSALCPPSPTVFSGEHLEGAIARSRETGDSFEWVFARGTTGEVATELAARPAEADAYETALFVRGPPARTHDDWSVRPVERLHDVATEFESCSRAAEIHELTVTAAADILDFDTSTMSVAEGEELVTKASTSAASADFHDSVPLEYGIAGETYRSNEGVRVDDVHGDPDVDPARSRYRSLMSVPVGSVGVLQAAATRVGAFSERDLELAELLAGHAADALERVRSVNALRENRRKIASLHDVADGMVTADGESRVFELAVDAAEEILRFDQCTFLRAVDGKFVSAATSTGLELPDRVLGTDEGVAGRVLRRGESELMDDVVVDEDAEPVFGDIVSGITVPLGDVGVFQAYSNEPAAFSESDVELAELLAAHVATCIERNRSEQALERQKTQFSSLVATLPGMVFRTATDDAGRLAFVNDYAAELTGYDPATLTGSDGVAFADLVHEEDRAGIVRNRRTALAEGGSYESTYRLRTADSGERWVRERATGLFTDGDASATLEGIVTDVTGNRRRAQLEVLNRFLRHNLRNDVQVISGHAENLERRLDDEAALESVDRVRSAARKLIGHSEKAGTLEGLLGTEREDDRTPLDLAAIVRRRVDAVQRRHDVSIRTSLPESCRVVAVPVLGAALQEAVENAARHGGEPPVEIEVSLDVGRADGRGDVLLCVRDDGPGIPEQDRVAIERRTETALTHSSGLGLWLIKWIVTASRGTLDIREREAGGTELRIRLHTADGD